jgi:nucleoside-diphosphate-sugar epimerase
MRLGFADLPQADLDNIVASTQAIGEQFGGCRILITGATGFVGRWVVAALAELRRSSGLSGLDIDVLVRDTSVAEERLGSPLWSEVNPIVGDITERWHLSSPVHYVVHGATPSSARSGSHDPSRVLATSVAGTDQLIQALERLGNVPRVLHLSSGAVYGPQPVDLDRIPETWLGGPSPFQATSPYAEGKRGAESLLEEAGRGGAVTAIQARLFAFMGPGLPTSEHFAIGNFAGEAAHGRTIRILGDGRTVRSYLDARDLTVWLLHLLVSGIPGRPYNVGSPTGLDLLAWAGLLAELADVPLEVGTSPVGERPAYVPDVANSADLGIAPVERDPREALASWLTWLRQVG